VFSRLVEAVIYTLVLVSTKWEYMPLYCPHEAHVIIERVNEHLLIFF